MITVNNTQEIENHAIAETTARCAANFGTYRSLQRHRAVFTAIAMLSN